MSSSNIFEEADMVAEEARKAKMQGKGVEVVNYNRKQRETKEKIEIQKNSLPYHEI